MVEIFIRDVNGKKTGLVYSSWEDTYNALVSDPPAIGEDDEILLVIIGGATIYSQLCCGMNEDIDVERLIGFFA